MAVYALYVPTAKRICAGLGMEEFRSREVCQRTLKARVRTGTSSVYYVSGPSSTFWQPATRAFPDTDETGHMRVWLRRSADSVPAPLSCPDEEWITTPGGAVQRLPWTDGDDILFDDGPAIVYAPSEAEAARVRPHLADTVEPPSARTTATTTRTIPKKPRRVIHATALNVCPECWETPSVTGQCGCLVKEDANTTRTPRAPLVPLHNACSACQRVPSAIGRCGCS